MMADDGVRAALVEHASSRPGPLVPGWRHLPADDRNLVRDISAKFGVNDAAVMASFIRALTY